MKLFSGFTLKIMAIVFMIMGNFYTYLNVPLREYGHIPQWFSYLGELSVPIFFYLIVDNFFGKGSRVKYMNRLLLMGTFMIFLDLILGIENNIFLSLALGVALMSSFEYIKTQEKGSKGFIGGIIVAIFLCILSCFTQYSFIGLLWVAVFYFFRDKKVLMTAGYTCIGGAIILLDLLQKSSLNEIGFSLLHLDYKWVMIFAIIPILLYNGKKGLSSKLEKWVFYWFYPIHLILIIVAGRFIA